MKLHGRYSTGVLEAMERDLENIDREFTELVLPFIETHKDDTTKKVFHRCFNKRLLSET